MVSVIGGGGEHDQFIAIRLWKIYLLTLLKE